MEINQYEVYLINLDPAVGHEIQKTRPCVVISPDEMNRNIQTIIIAPMTTKSHDYPTRVKLTFGTKITFVFHLYSFKFISLSLKIVKRLVKLLKIWRSCSRQHSFVLINQPCQFHLRGLKPPVKTDLMIYYSFNSHC
jgi:mRNA interferase MazF